MQACKTLWRKCGEWGVKKRTMPAKGQNFDGFTAPLWRNPSRRCILFICVFSAVLFVALLITFLSVFNETVCSVDYRSLMIIQIIILFFDGKLTLLKFTFQVYINSPSITKNMPATKNGPVIWSLCFLPQLLWFY